MALSIGTRIGGYEVIGKLGEGGMGEVYRAHDSTLDRDVALKVLPEAFTADPERLARFQREAKVLASLNHSNIGGIHGFESADDVQALVLELIEGPTLADRISEGPVPIDEALAIANQISEALEAAHERGIVHRDLKPANVKLRPDGTAKVLDFGLAKAVTVEGGGSSGSNAPTMSITGATQLGMVIGTAAYMAPEQARGKSVDQRADVWALGVLLFEMLTGQRVFHGDDVSLTLAKVLEGEPNWEKLPDDLPPRVTKLLQSCLKKDPKQRVHAVGDVRLALEGAFETTGNSGAEALGQQAHPRPFLQGPIGLAISALVACVIGAAAVWSLTQETTPGVVRFPIPLPASQDFSGRFSNALSLSPDGSKVVYAANGSLWLRTVDQFEATEMPGTEDASGPFFSADGLSVGFSSGGQLKKVSVTGGAPVTITDIESLPRGVSWGDDDMILYGQPDGVMQVPGSSGTPEMIVPVGDEERIHGPQKLPDGEWVLFTTVGPGEFWDSGNIVAQSMGTGERVVLVEGARDGRYLPTGHLAYSLRGVFFVVPFDVDNREVLGGPVPLVEDVQSARGPANGASQVAVSKSGVLAYVPGFVGQGQFGVASELVWVDREGREDPLGVESAFYTWPRLSPDGRQVAVSTRSTDGQQLWVVDVSRATSIRFTFEGEINQWPAWMPDGERISFSSNRAGRGGELYVKRADGSGEVESLFAGEGNQVPTSWSPDGERLAFYAITNGAFGRDMWMLNVNGEATSFLATEFSERVPMFSPDGEWLAYVSDESGRDEVYVRLASGEGGRYVISTAGGTEPMWNPRGGEIFYRDEDALMTVPIEMSPSMTVGQPRQLFDGPYALDAGGGGNLQNYDVGPDGDRFLMVKPFGDENGGASPHINIVLNWFEELQERVPVP